MALKITCPHCGHPHRLDEPFPLPGSERQCVCGRSLSITYPMGLVDRLRIQGKRFEGEAPPTVSDTIAIPIDPPLPRPVAARAISAERTASTPPERTSSDRTTQPEPGQARPTDRTEVAAPPATAEPSAPRVRLPPPDTRSVGVPTVPTGRPKPAKAKPRRSWFKRLLFTGAAFAAVGGVVALLAVGGWSWYCARGLPSVETLGKYKPPTVTVVYDSKERLLGEIYDQRRYVVPLETIPPVVRNAFIAAEDGSFYEHGGVDYMGIVRAIIRNTLAGRKAQGASTITQQVTRNFLLSNEKTLTRKTKEVLLAWRIEDTFDKDHILYLYLNQIYLGSHAYGVEAAARVYFGKHVGELTLAEAAMIAGLPQRPSDYSPHRNFEKAKARQSYVLGQMVAKGLATQAQADEAAREPLTIVERTNDFLHVAPWFTEYVRKYLVEKYGEDRVLNEGLVVVSTCDLDLQKVAQKAVSERVSALDERKGWRGASETLDAAGIQARIEKLARRDDPALEGARYPGVVVSVAKDHLVVDLGTEKALVPLAWTEWAYDASGPRKKLDDLTKTFKRGDVVSLDVTNRDYRAAAPFKDAAGAFGNDAYVAGELYQPSELQGALFSYRLTDGGVSAMVGGVDYKETNFNRAVQAERQVGSTFKPIVYAAAIESRRFTPATIVQDAPIIYNTLKSQLWKPENYGESYLGDITLRKALALSRNVVTIRVLDNIGVDPVFKMARRLGIESPMESDLSMGLGSGSLTLVEMARAYSAFATMGRKVDVHFIERVTDRDGTILEQYTPPPEWERVLSPEVGGVVNWLLQEVATSGTAGKSQQLGLHVAGKTGTTNDFKDAWFVGFNTRLVTAVWVGYDQPKSIGASSTGGQTALPIWMDYMKVAAPKADDKPFALPGTLAWVGIDEKTGRPMVGGRSMPFLPGTAPSGAAVVAGQKTTEDLLTTEF